MTDEQIAAQIAALKREKRGYVQRLQRAEKDGDAETAKKMEKRIADVDAALGEDAEHACDECEFEAKSAAGLANHKRTHEDDEEE